MVTVAGNVSVGGCYYCLNPMFVLVGSINRSGLLQLSFELSFDRLFCFWVVVVVWGGSEASWLCLQAAARAVCFCFCGVCCVYLTNHRNKGLISVDRRTCLLSYVQYPVSIKVVYKGFNALSARKATEFGVGPRPIATREHREQIYRRFPA